MKKTTHLIIYYLFLSLIFFVSNKIKGQTVLYAGFEDQNRVDSEMTLKKGRIDNAYQFERETSLGYKANMEAGAVDSKNPFIIYYAYNCSLKKYDLNLKQIFTIGNFDNCLYFTGFEFDPLTGNLFALANKSLYSINIETASVNLIGETGIRAKSVAIDGSSNMFAIDVYNSSLYSINKTTAETTFISSLDFNAITQNGMAWDTDSDTIYLTVRNNNGGIELRKLDKFSGKTNIIKIFNGSSEPFAKYCKWITFINSALLSSKDYKNDLLKLYPNPANDVIYFISNVELKSVIIYDSLGKLILEKESESSLKKIDIAQLNYGVYTIKVLSEKKYQILKFIKK